MANASKTIKSSSSIKLNTILLKNFATFQDTTIHFDKGFNTILGETGSGKSLVLEAIQLVLGQRADRKFIRKDADFTTIEATFSITSPAALYFLDKIGHPTDGEDVIIKRILYKTGKSKSFINFQQCSLSVLQEFAHIFIDLVGQFENQKLLDINYQLDLIDSYANHDKQLQKYNHLFAELKKYQFSKEQLEIKKQEDRQRRDFLLFQINEFEELNITVEEEIQLNQEKEHLTNHEQRQQNLLDLQNHLEGEEYSILNAQKELIHKLSSFTEFSEYQKNLEESYQSLTELSYQVSLLLTEQNDESRLNFIIDRLDQIQKIKRKYNLELAEITHLIADYKKQLEEFDNIDLKLKELEQNISKTTDQLYELASSLHNSRVKVAKKIEKEITQVIRQLNMQGATLYINIQKQQELTVKGISKVEIKAETNLGEGIFPLRQIASGGELSRVLLAFRQVLSTRDTISIFLFDEIDTGIGGETALKIGQVLAQVSSQSQVIAITHLPQLATFADQLIDITKVTTKDTDVRTISQVAIITDKKEREEYVKNMIPLSAR